MAINLQICQNIASIGYNNKSITLVDETLVLVWRVSAYSEPLLLCREILEWLHNQQKKLKNTNFPLCTSKSHLYTLHEIWVPNWICRAYIKFCQSCLCLSNSQYLFVLKRPFLILHTFGEAAALLLTFQ